MFNSRFEALFSQLPADYYDYIVIDEAHHSQADSYRKLFSHFHPQLLIGLTATPERMDGKTFVQILADASVLRYASTSPSGWTADSFPIPVCD